MPCHICRSRRSDNGVPEVPMVLRVLGVLRVLRVLGVLGVVGGGAALRVVAAAQLRPVLVGTWTLSAVERMSGGAPAAVPLPRGLLVFDGAGHVFELSSAGRRIVYAASQPTPTEARAVYDNYSGF